MWYESVRLIMTSLPRLIFPGERNVKLAFVVGIAFGITISYFFLSSTQNIYFLRRSMDLFGTSKQQMSSDVEGEIRFTASTGGNVNEEFQRGEAEVAKQMAKSVRVLCWIMTNPANHKKKARHVKATWGKRCNILLFMSSAEDSELPTIKLPVKEGRNHLWAKTKEAFKYVYEHHLNDADWFMKADDDTYVIVENLRLMLSDYQPWESLFFGSRFRRGKSKLGFMSGGAGYVLSREAVRVFYEKGINNPKICRKDHGGAEDVEIAKCLENLGVKVGDSRDSLGRDRFFPYMPERHLIPGQFPKNFWYSKNKYYPNKEGMECCSDSAVSFHYVSPKQMYVMEYFIYHLRPYGFSHEVKYHSSKAISLTTDNLMISNTTEFGSNYIISMSSTQYT